ncbi:MAG: hypothetical protein C0623_05820 [Desulfuromonas sp.]|nr:MAG: hypothetical protein C0623_05820 [Desulfuromonas sp.]
MGVQVEFKDGVRGEVPETVLNRLIDLNLIARFKRQSGWVSLGRDPVRKSRMPVISIPERRSAMLAWTESPDFPCRNEARK